MENSSLQHDKKTAKPECDRLPEKAHNLPAKGLKVNQAFSDRYPKPLNFRVFQTTGRTLQAR
ncbi:hypothetical protein AB4P97_09810 [Pseudomonas sp. A1230]|uniref:hypothetical protein n=1 Tax=Pseudomonas sp. A1230 TaxID=3235106 RepID=UPI003784C6F7